MQPQQVPPPGPPVSHQRIAPPRPYIGLLLIGITILLIGGIIYMSVGFLDDPDDNDGWGGGDPWEDYRDTIRTMVTLGNVIQYVGIMVLSVGLILGALKDESLHANVRLGMLIAMGLIVGFKIMSISPWLGNF
jgi:hypothetical protein